MAYVVDIPSMDVGDVEDVKGKKSGRGQQWRE
jgi:hypothetical protein